MEQENSGVEQENSGVEQENSGVEQEGEVRARWRRVGMVRLREADGQRKLIGRYGKVWLFLE